MDGSMEQKKSLSDSTGMISHSASDGFKAVSDDVITFCIMLARNEYVPYSNKLNPRPKQLQENLLSYNMRPENGTNK